jgi:hypothetical protein
MIKPIFQFPVIVKAALISREDVESVKNEFMFEIYHIDDKEPLPLDKKFEKSHEKDKNEDDRNRTEFFQDFIHPDYKPRVWAIKMYNSGKNRNALMRTYFLQNGKSTVIWSKLWTVEILKMKVGSGWRKFSFDYIKNNPHFDKHYYDKIGFWKGRYDEFFYIPHYEKFSLPTFYKTMGYPGRIKIDEDNIDVLYENAVESGIRSPHRNFQPIEKNAKKMQNNYSCIIPINYNNIESDNEGIIIANNKQKSKKAKNNLYTKKLYTSKKNYKISNSISDSDMNDMEDSSSNNEDSLENNEYVNNNHNNDNNDKEETDDNNLDDNNLDDNEKEMEKINVIILEDSKNPLNKRKFNIFNNNDNINNAFKIDQNGFPINMKKMVYNINNQIPLINENKQNSDNNNNRIIVKPKKISTNINNINNIINNTAFDRINNIKIIKADSDKFFNIWKNQSIAELNLSKNSNKINDEKFVYINVPKDSPRYNKKLNLLNNTNIIQDDIIPFDNDQYIYIWDLYGFVIFVFDEQIKYLVRINNVFINDKDKKQYIQIEYFDRNETLVDKSRFLNNRLKFTDTIHFKFYFIVDLYCQLFDLPRNEYVEWFTEVESYPHDYSNFKIWRGYDNSQRGLKILSEPEDEIIDKFRNIKIKPNDNRDFLDIFKSLIKKEKRILENDAFSTRDKVIEYYNSLHEEKYYVTLSMVTKYFYELYDTTDKKIHSDCLDFWIRWKLFLSRILQKKIVFHPSFIVFTNILSNVLDVHLLEPSGKRSFWQTFTAQLLQRDDPYQSAPINMKRDQVFSLYITDNQLEFILANYKHHKNRFQILEREDTNN